MNLAKKSTENLWKVITEGISKSQQCKVFPWHFKAPISALVEFNSQN